MSSLQESINRHGILQPIVVNKSLELIDGYNRVGCVKDDTLIPCTIIGSPGVHLVPKKCIKRRKRC